MIETIVFDMDEVLADYSLDHRLALLSEWSRRPAAEIRAAIWGTDFEERSDSGELSADEYLRGTGERMGYPLTAEQWVHARRAAMTPNEPVLDVARRLTKHRPIAMFSNNGLMLKRHLAEVFPAAAELFGDRAIFSAELGATKPSPDAFRRLAARLGVAASTLLFFDDSAEYIAGARTAGVHAYRFEGVDSLLRGLGEHGLGEIARG